MAAVRVTPNALAHQVVYRPMQHPHFVRAALAQLGYLGADDGEQLDLFDVDWGKVKERGEAAYRLALLAEAQGKQLGMPQDTIDEAIRLLLTKHRGLNMFRALFGFHPYDRSRYDGELAVIKADAPTVVAWYESQLVAYTAARLELLKEQARQIITREDLAKLAKRAKWNAQQVKDALAGKNIYQLKPASPIPWVAIGLGSAAGLLLAWYLWRR